MSDSFVHLSVHSEYSLSDGIIRVKPLVERVAELGMPAVALTDRSNLFAMVKFYRAAFAAGVKPVVGVDAWIQNPEDARAPHRLILLAQNRQGYRNITRLISSSYREGQHLGVPMIAPQWMEDAHEGVIALCGGRAGDVGHALGKGKSKQARRLLERWLRLFGDRYYLSVSRAGHPGEEDHVHACVDLAAEAGVPVVAINDACFLARDNFEAHEVRVCIHDGRTLDDSRRPRNYTDQQYLKSPEEMAELFADLPEALENTVEIARRCNLELSLGKNYLPEFPVPEGCTIDSYLRDQAQRGLDHRLETAEETTGLSRDGYVQRLELELDVINQMGFPGYFLIVADFIQWAKNNGIPVGPGRGSGAGSLVAYALQITDLDPIEHDLLFERFLNPDRVSMPDFDIDFCMEKRDRVIDYVAGKYGRDSVSQIITYGSMAAKAVVRDVGRVLGQPYGFVDRIAKLVPFEVGISLTKALEQSPDLKEQYDTQADVREIIDMAMMLEGLARNAGKHAGGVVIAPTVLTDFTPLYCEAGGDNLVTQYDKDDVEAVGLVKFDFLGLRTLTIIDWALKSINARRAARGEPPLDIASIPVDDAPAFSLLKTGETTAVFQLESRGMKDLIRKLQPDNFEDITALVALFRPGPLQSGMVDDFINRKHGRARVEYPHPDLEPILNATYGVILYQEQVMQIAQVLAGYTLGGADLLRRAMGKKNAEKMAKQGKIFVEGAKRRGVAEETAKYIFDLMEKFAGYGFNKSHSAAYALVSYQTLWLKAHYPAPFMAAVLSSDMDATDKVVTFIEECRSMGLKVAPPHVNRSAFMFTPDGDDGIFYGLGAIKGIGEAAIADIVAARDTAGPFDDLFGFCRRIDLKRVNRRVLEALVRSGALDELGPNRATLMAQLPLAVKMAEQRSAMEAAGQNDLFGMEVSAPVRQGREPGEAQKQEWEEGIRLQGEKETLGLYLTGHPVDRYEHDLAAMGVARLDSLDGSTAPTARNQKGERVRVAGYVVAVNRRVTQRGQMASVLLDDRKGRIEAVFFSEAFETHRDLLVADRVLVVEGNLAFDDFRGGLSIRANRAMPLEEMRSLLAVGMTLRLDGAKPPGDDDARPDRVRLLARHLQPFVGGRCRVLLNYANDTGRCLLELGTEWSVEVSDELIRQLQHLLGEDAVSISYHGGRLPDNEKETRSASAKEAG
ncbi:MAG: DNA polymerase III subunit alpha [Pseudomonadota bacterium]